jgi:UDP-glucose 4-epimerase
MAERTIVTGGLGYVGARLVAQLTARGDAVTVIDDGSVGTPRNLERAGVGGAVRIETADVRDTGRIAQLIGAAAPVTVFHLAAIHYIPLCEREPARAVSVNTAGTQSVLDALTRAGYDGALVCASTAAVYAPSSDAHTESSSVGPTDIYGLTKLWMEQAAQLFADRTRAPVGIGRLFNVIGPGETNPHLFPAIIEQVQRGNVLMLGDLSTRRDYIDVDDIARGLIAIADHVHRDGSLICNLGTEHATSGREAVDAIAAAVGRDSIEIVADPARMRVSDRPMLLSDCSRAARLLGWRARHSLADAVARMVAEPLPVLLDRDPV